MSSSPPICPYLLKVTVFSLVRAFHVSKKQIRTVGTGIQWQWSVQSESCGTCSPQWRTARGKVCETDGSIWRQVKDTQSLSLGPHSTTVRSHSLHMRASQYELRRKPTGSWLRIWLPVLCVSTKRVFILDYKMYVLSFLRAWRLSQDVLVDAGFQCEKASVLRETMKETRCTSTSHSQPFGPRIWSIPNSSQSSPIRSYFWTLSLGLSILFHRHLFSKGSRIVWLPVWAPRYPGPLKALPISQWHV